MQIPAKVMKPFRSFFTTLILLLLSHTTLAQYESIFKTPFPQQIHLLDSVCIHVAKLDSVTFYKEIEKLRTAAANTDDYTRLNLERAILSVKTDEGYELENAVSKGEKIIKEAMNMNAPELAAVEYMTLGFYYELKKQSFGKAFENYLKAYNLLEKIPEEKLPPRQYALYVVSEAYYRYNDFGNALLLSLRTDKTFRVKTSVYVFNTDLIGMCYLKMTQYDSARVYFQRVFDHAHIMENEVAWKGIALGNIGVTYFRENNFNEATRYLSQAVALTLQGGVYDNTVGFASRLSEIFRKQNKSIDAKKFLDISLNAAHMAGDNDDYFTAYNAAASYYRSIKDPAGYIAYSDSANIFNDKLAAQKDLNIKYKIEMAVQSEQVKAREKSFENEKQQQLLLRNAIIVFVVLLMIISLLLYNRAQIKNKSRQQQLIAQKQLAENELQTATQQLYAFTQSIREKNEFIEKASQEIARVNAELNVAKNERHGLASQPETDNHSLQLLQNSVLLTDENWRNFTHLFEKVHDGFFQRLKQKLPGLSPAETRFAALIKLQLSNKEMASMLGVGTEAIRQIRSRLKRKLNSAAEERIEELVEKI
jgi:DNA-binding CsgD family transcriptional regulator